MLLATMDISAHAVSLADRPQRAIWVTSVRMRREDRSFISFHLLADLGGEGVRSSFSWLPKPEETSCADRNGTAAVLWRR
jgi:hypothetical protein